MASYLGYEFGKVQLKREVYRPIGHQTVEEDLEIIRRGLVQIVSGNSALPMDVKGFPIDPAVREIDKKIRGLLVDWLSGQLGRDPNAII